MKKRIFVFFLVLAIVFSAVSFSACNQTNDNSSAPEKERGFVHQDGTKIVDGYGNAIGLIGTNVGGWLVQEEWLVPTEVGGYAQRDMILTLANRFGIDKANELVEIYEDNFITEQDFANIKNLGMNCVRIPFTYMTLMDIVRLKDGSDTEYEYIPWNELELKDDAFKRLDFAVQMCEKYGLYAILDLHGAVGSQSGNDHTGDISVPDGGIFWNDDETGTICREKTKELWIAIANRYKDNKWIACYDLINEPGIKTNGNQVTDKKTWDFFDVLYKAIRNVDENHMISVESCWEAGNLPAPEKYGWENMLYQYHHYNWASSNIPNSSFYELKVFGLNNDTRNFPVLIGEFNVWGDSHPDKTAFNKTSTQTDMDAWDGVLELYCGMGWHFTTWNYKHAATYSSWGLYNLNDGDFKQANFKTMSADEIAKIWSEHNAENYHENTDLTSIIKKYIPTFNTNGYDDSEKEYSIL